MAKYERVLQDLIEKIEAGTYAVGALLPSEHQLTNRYGVSRETARKALAVLTERGYIQKIMGKGSIVIDHSHLALSLHALTSYTELTQNQPTSRTELLALEKTVVPRSTFIELDPHFTEREAMLVRRLRFLDGAPIIIDNDYLLTSVIPDLPRQAAEHSLYDYIENTLEMTIGYSTRQIRAEPATEEDRDLLRLAKGEYVVITTSVAFLEDTRLFQYTESRHRADKFSYRFFARRQITK